MNKLDKQYTDLLQDILDNGVIKQDRTQTGTISLFGRQIRHQMSEGFPLLTTKRMSFKTIVTELLWFLRGDTNIKYLVDNNNFIWVGDAYKNYLDKKMFSSSFEALIESDKDDLLTQEQFINKIKTDDEFVKEWGELGPIYGRQWRSWSSTEWGVSPTKEGGRAGYSKKTVDQIQNLINDLKTNPDSRRLMVSAWNVGEIDQMVLPPCHYGFQVYTRELTLNERNELLNKATDRNHKRENCFSDEEFKRETLQDCKAFNIPTRTISLMWNQRSVDTFLGLPFNIASYGLLLEIIAKEVNMIPDQLIGNLGDVHLYSNHIEQAKEQIGRILSWEERRDIAEKTIDKKEFEGFGYVTPFTDWAIHAWLNSKNIPTITREPFPLPTFNCPAIDEISHTTFDELVFKLQPEDFYMDYYQSHPTIKAPLSN